MSKFIHDHDSIERNAKGQYYPATREELAELVVDENISLGDIDVGRITDMKGLFTLMERGRDDFSGIEQWDVSKVRNMSSMFSGMFPINGDISC